MSAGYFGGTVSVHENTKFSLYFTELNENMFIFSFTGVSEISAIVR